MTEPNGDVRAMVEQIAKALVDAPDQVFVEQFEDAGETVLELEVAPEDVGKIIGRHGRTARALRTLLSAASLKLNKRFELEIID